MIDHPGRLVYAGAIVVALCLPSVASASTRYAEPGGDGPAASCPAANPCDLTTAVESPSVANGDEIVVLPGRHLLPGDVPSDGFGGSNPLYITKTIQVHGTVGTPPTIVAGPDGGAVYIDEPGAVVSDLVIEDGLGLATGMAERVIVHTTANFACYFDKYAVPVEPPPVIRDSVCRSATEGSAVGAGVGVSVYGGDPRTLVARLVNVTALGTSGVSVGALSGNSATVEATNVIAVGSATGSDVSSFTEGGTSADGVAASLTLANSNYDTALPNGTGASVTPAGSGTNQTAAPILASPSTGDLRQVTGSPTIDAGTAAPLLGSFDFEGQARVQGPAPDIGADEGSIGIPFVLSAAARRAIEDLAVTLRCEIPLCGFEISGSIRIRGGKAHRPARRAKRFELKPRALTLGAGEQRKVKLKLPSSSRKKVEALLEDGAKAEATIDVGTGAAGSADRARIKIKP